MTHPNIITEAMADGSDAISDWPLLNALLTTAAGADLVALHAGGGGYAGLLAERRDDGCGDRHRTAPRGCAAALNVDTALGVLRHADAGYEEAIETRVTNTASAVACRFRAMRDLDLHAVHAAVAGGSVLAAGGGGWVDHGMLVGTTAVQYGTPRLATLDEVDPDAMLATVSAIGAPGGGRLGDAPGRLRARAAAADGGRDGADHRHRHRSERLLDDLQRLGRLGGAWHARDRRRRRRPRAPDRQDGLVRARGRRRLPDRPGGRGRQPRRGSLPRGRDSRDRPPHRQRAAHRVRPVGRLHLLRPQPAAGLVRRRARRSRRDQLRAGRSARRSSPPRTERAAADDRRHRGAPRRHASSPTAPCASSELRTENAFDIGTIVVGELELGLRQRVPDRRVRRRATRDLPRRARRRSRCRPGRIISIAESAARATRSPCCTCPKANVPLGDGVKEPSVYPEVEAMLGKPLAQYALA